MVWRTPDGSTADDVPGYTRPLPEPTRQTGQPGQPGQPPSLQRPPRSSSRKRRYLKRAAITLVTLAVVLALAAGVLYIVTPSAGEATPLAQQQARQHGIAYPGPAVPANFARPLVATEDHRFYTEPGIDLLAVGRVVEANLTDGSDQGGATIEQQLAKMLYTPAGPGSTPSSPRLSSRSSSTSATPSSRSSTCTPRPPTTATATTALSRRAAATSAARRAT